MKGKYVIISPELEEQIVADLKGGMYVMDAAKKYEIGRFRISKIRDKHDIPRNGSWRVGRMTNERRDKIIADLKAGMHVKDIIQKHHLGYTALADIQAEYGLYRHQGKNDELTPEDWEELAPKWDSVRVIVLAGLAGRHVRAIEKHWLWRCTYEAKETTCYGK